MKTRLQLTILNWRFWIVLPVMAVFFPVLVAQGLCYGLASVFAAADEAIEYTFSPLSSQMLRFVHKNKQEKVTP